MKKVPALKIVFCSNFMNHHQLYFSEAVLARLGGAMFFLRA